MENPPQTRLHAGIAVGIPILLGLLIGFMGWPISKGTPFGSMGDDLPPGASAKSVPRPNANELLEKQLADAHMTQLQASAELQKLRSRHEESMADQAARRKSLEKRLSQSSKEAEELKRILGESERSAAGQFEEYRRERQAMLASLAEARDAEKGDEREHELEVVRAREKMAMLEEEITSKQQRAEEKAQELTDLRDAFDQFRQERREAEVRLEQAAQAARLEVREARNETESLRRELDRTIKERDVLEGLYLESQERLTEYSRKPVRVPTGPSELPAEGE